ncbi:hypothetical protein DENSPDRAFT_887167 [Dentipellis sp. KUC8613]|nr:hypothetical protein DENSPDRAFT_887167 [Dentipellis sp. KUC8613]
MRPTHPPAHTSPSIRRADALCFTAALLHCPSRVDTHRVSLILAATRPPSFAARTVSYFLVLHRTSLPRLLHVVSCASALSRTACTSLSNLAPCGSSSPLSRAALRLRPRALHGAVSPLVAPTRHPLAPRRSAMRPILASRPPSCSSLSLAPHCVIIRPAALSWAPLCPLEQRRRPLSRSWCRPIAFACVASPSPAMACRRSLVLLPCAPAAPFHAVSSPSAHGAVHFQHSVTSSLRHVGRLTPHPAVCVPSRRPRATSRALSTVATSSCPMEPSRAPYLNAAISPPSAAASHLSAAAPRFAVCAQTQQHRLGPPPLPRASTPSIMNAYASVTPVQPCSAPTRCVGARAPCCCAARPSNGAGGAFSHRPTRLHSPFVPCGL